jgi:hypothetical protein
MKLTDYMAAGLDPVALAKLSGLNPDPWQETVLRSTSQRLLLLCCRQSGKSTISALIAVHVAIFEPGSLVLLLSPSMRQSQELFRKCLAVYKTLGRPIPSESENTMALTLENGSRVVSLPGSEATSRGFSGVALLLVDEAARVPDESYYAARPVVAVSTGRIILMSTPAGRRGAFYHTVMDPQGWEVIKVPASDCPRLSPAFLEEERRTMGDYIFGAEYNLEFVDDETSIFGEDTIAAAFADNTISPLFEESA